MKRIYLDYNATAPLRAEAWDAMTAAMALGPLNPSSIHGFGRAARKLVEDARGAVAALAKVRAAQVIFNAHATEGNNTILSGYPDSCVYVSAMEHPSVLEAVPHARKIPVTRGGVVDLSALSNMLNHEAPALIAVQLVNSETGVIQPVAELSALAKARGARVLCDAVQAAGRIEIDFAALGVDYLILSAHKFGGPAGVGALVFREGLQMPKFMHGGGQEKRQRAGTENVIGIAGAGAAAQLCHPESYQAHTKALQQKLESGLRSIANDIIIAGESAPRVTNTTNVILPGVPAETQLMAMDLEGIAASSGSACSSGAMKPSHVLSAMGLGDDHAKSALRFSTGWDTTESDIDDALAAYARMVSRVRK
jgi:cysteine desulfurase